MKLKPAFLLLVTATVIWGATAPIMKVTLTQVPLFTLAFIRQILATAIFLPFVVKDLKIQKEDLKTLVVATLLGTNINLFLFFKGLELTEAINASIITAAVPIITLFAAHLYLKEKLTLRLVLASITAFLGTIVIVGTPILSLNLKAATGNLLLIGATFAFVAYEIYAKKLLKKYSALKLTFFMFAIGAVVFMPFSAFEFIKNPTWVNSVNIEGLFGILCGVFLASALASYFWQKGLSLLPAGEAALFFYVDPISGIIASILLLGEKITQSFSLGAILIVVGVFLAEHHRKNHILHQKHVN